ncbi:MAG: hypothetical protein NVSMB42_11180 [Herpetosiphon sp.]
MRLLSTVLAYVGVLGLAVLGVFVGSRTASGQGAGPSGVYQQTQQAGGLSITLTLTPQTGDQGVLIQVLDGAGKPVNRATVAVEFEMRDMAMNVVPVVTVAAMDGRYDGRGALSMAGLWDVRVAVTPPGASVVNVVFPVPVVTASPLPTRPVVPIERPAFGRWWVATAAALVTAGLAAFAMAQVRRDRRTGAILLSSWVLLFAGVGTWFVPSVVATVRRRSPDPQAALKRAQPLYQRNCLPCHGIGGRGDGPAARGLNPKPADLTAAHVEQHPDGQIFSWIHDGFPGAAMPAFSTQLSNDQIWELVDFVRHFRNQQP